MQAPGGLVCAHGDNLLSQTMLHLNAPAMLHPNVRPSGVRDPPFKVRAHIVLDSNQGYEPGAREPANRIKYE